MSGATFWHWFWRASRWSFFGLLAVVIAIAGALAVAWSSTPGEGCRFAEYGFICSGFFGAEWIEAAANITGAVLIFLPAFAAYGITEGLGGPPSIDWLTTIGVAVWILYLFILATPLRWVWQCLVGRKNSDKRIPMSG